MASNCFTLSIKIDCGQCYLIIWDHGYINAANKALSIYLKTEPELRYIITMWYALNYDAIKHFIRILR